MYNNVCILKSLVLNEMRVKNLKIKKIGLEWNESKDISNMMLFLRACLDGVGLDPIPFGLEKILVQIPCPSKGMGPNPFVSKKS